MLLLLVLGLGQTIRPAGAHGGGTPQLTNAEVGPYWVSVWTQPDPARVGEWHITVAVAEPPSPGSATNEAGPPVLDATVSVRLTSLERPGQTIMALATHEDAANKLFYEADLDLPRGGQWRASVDVQGPAGGGQASFELQVLPGERSSGLAWAAWGGAGLAVLALGWLVVRRRSVLER
ncbi:MAG: hypothetical protein ACE5H9_02765 [Anaerolineae bacterium]